MRPRFAIAALIAILILMAISVILRSHSPDWVFHSPQDIVATAASDEGVIAVSTEGGYLHFLDSKGNLKASVSNAGWPTFLTLTFLPNGTLVAAGRHGMVVGVHEKKITWTTHIGDCLTSRLHYVDFAGNAWINRIVEEGENEQVLRGLPS